MENPLVRDSRSLEDSFFAHEDQRLVESLREMKALEQTTGFLAEVTGIRNPPLLEHLARLNVTPATAASLAILPLVEVAWADGTVHDDERLAILRALEKTLFFATIDRDVIEAWLERRPPQALLDAWTRYVADLKDQLPPAEYRALGDELLDHARQVAQAAGGFLGFGGVSPAEQKVLDRLGGLWK